MGKTKSKYSVSRRDFMQKTTAGLLAVSAYTTIPGCKKKANIATMPKRKFGKTGLDVSLLSFGGGSQFVKNKEGAWEEMLERAVQSGINLFDTCSSYVYGNALSSEERFGRVLPRYRRQIYIATKVDSRNPDEAMKEFERSLKRMKTDYVDILLVHSLEKSEDIPALEKGLYAKMRELKEQGAARFIGFSSMNSAEKSREFIEKLHPDVCILAINPTKYGGFKEIALPAARKNNVGTLAMKVMKNVVGKDATAKELMQYALGQEGVSTAVVAHYGIETLIENTDIVKKMDNVTSAGQDQSALESRLAHMAGPHVLSWARPDYRDGSMC